jgi:phosphate:Na+ symporter
MFKHIIFFTILVILTYGFWLSSDFKEISAGVAIFLFGMLSLEEGFKAFTGGLLERLLRKTTDKTWKSLAFGVISTTAMQSSSLVSVITISFLSTGLIGLSAGIGIVFGANLGTTTGAWLIAGFGMKVKLSAYAMPMLVFGVIGIFQKSNTLKGLGYILAGLGFLFLGIHHMKEGFDAFRDTIDLTAFAVDGYYGVLVFTLIGIFATVVMQSSHATLVLIITALSAQQITYDNALALAIGANVGTTITAIIGAMSANIQGKRLAAAHLVFNVFTGALAIIFIQQLGSAVEWIANALGVDDNNYILKLAIFHSVFNSLGVILMVPFINNLASKLTALMPEKQQTFEKPIYLSKAAIELPDTAITAVRKETLRLYDNAFGIIAHGLNFHRKEILSNNALNANHKKNAKLIAINFDAEYDHSIKSLYSEIVEFISRAQVAMKPEQADELFLLRTAGRDIVEAIKDTKHMHKNFSHYIVSDNPYIKAEYSSLRTQLGNLMRELAKIRVNEDGGSSLLSFDSLRLEMEVNDSTTNGKLEQLIRENKLTAKMATSLMNDSTYAYSIARNLIHVGETLFSASNTSMRETEQDIALTNDEVAEIISNESFNQ